MSIRRDRPQGRPSGRPPSLEEILGGLQRQAASSAFTAKALAAAGRVARHERRGHVGRRWSVLAFAGALVAAALAGFLLAPRSSVRDRAVGRDLDARRDRAPASATLERTRQGDPEVEALRSRMRDLERELLELERLAAERQPLIAIEGDHADYLIDLRDFLPTVRDQRAIPVGYRPPDAGRGDGPR